MNTSTFPFPHRQTSVCADLDKRVLETGQRSRSRCFLFVGRHHLCVLKQIAIDPVQDQKIYGAVSSVCSSFGFAALLSKISPVCSDSEPGVSNEKWLWYGMREVFPQRFMVDDAMAMDEVRRQFERHNFLKASLSLRRFVHV